MTTIAEGAEILRKAKEAGTIKPVPPDSIPTAYPIPPAEPAMNPLLRGPMPAGSVNNADTVRQWHTSAIPQTRVLPLPSTANAVAGAQAASQAITQIANTPTKASGVTSVGLTAPAVLFVTPVSGSPVTSAGTLALALIGQQQNFVFAGPPGTAGSIALDSIASNTAPQANGLNSLTVTNVAAQANDFALFAAAPIAASSTADTGPDASWTQLFAMPGLTGAAGVWWKNVAAAGPISGTVSITTAGGSVLMGTIVTALTAGGTPTVRQTNFATGVALNNGQTTTLAFTGNTLLGSTLFLVAGLSTLGGPAPFSITDSQGNQYVQVSTVTNKLNTGVVESLAIYAASGSKAAADTLTIRNVSGANQTCFFYILEVTALAPPVQTPIFRPLVPADIPGMQQNGILDLVHGGTQADLSGTGGTNNVLFQNSTGAAITVAQADYSTLAGNSGASRYNQQTLVEKGLVTEVAHINLTGQAAAISAAALYTTPVFNQNGNGMYRISWVAKVTTPATTSCVLGGGTGFQITYTDNDDSVSVTTPVWWGGGNNGATPTSASTNTTQNQLSGEIYINSKPVSAITYSFGYTSVGGTAMQYNLHIRVEAI